MVKSSEALLAHPWISDKGPVRHFVHVHEKLQTRHGREEHVGQGHIHQEVKPMKTWENMGKRWETPLETEVLSWSIWPL